MKKPKCSQCGKEMVWTKAKNIDFHYWKCETSDCKFLHPVWKQELSNSEQKFINELTNKKI